MTASPPVSNADVAQLLGSSPEPGASQWAYLDVRTCEEYALGHIPQAYNVPLKLGGLAGLTDNAQFLRVVTSTFAPDRPLIVGCRSGARARTAVDELRRAGFAQVRLHEASFMGCRDAFGRLTPGWQPEGYEVSTEFEAGRTYEELLRKSDV